MIKSNKRIIEDPSSLNERLILKETQNHLKKLQDEVRKLEADLGLSNLQVKRLEEAEKVIFVKSFIYIILRMTKLILPQIKSIYFF